MREYYYNTTTLKEVDTKEFGYARPQDETLEECRGSVRLQPASTLETIRNAVLYRDGYHLCSRFDSYLGRCSRGGCKDIPIIVMYRM